MNQERVHGHLDQCSCTDFLRQSCASDASLELHRNLAHGHDLTDLKLPQRNGYELWKVVDNTFELLTHVTCSSPYVCLCETAGGPRACASNWFYHALQNARIGATIPLEMFAGSPQQHALLNRHITDYYRTRNRALETTPYNIPNSQRHLLQPLGMEQPQPDAPETPHALHKSIEEFQLVRLGRQFLQPNNFGVVSVKTSKLALLPTAGSVQNPVFQAKDVSRYPGTAIRHAHLRDFPVHLMHDVSSEVTPHELVEKLVSENPEGHLLVTGMNPIEVADGAATFEPSSHTIEYDMGNFNFIFTGSESESYFTPSSVTKTWLRTSSVCASSGRVYHVTLLDYKLGHCVWHIYCGQSLDQDTRTFSTGSYCRIPAAVSGTWSDEYLPVKLVTSILDFTQRTPDFSNRNLSAKVSQLSNGMNPSTTARERWIATHIAALMAPRKTWDWYFNRFFWDFLYLVSFQWHMLSPMPDLHTYIDERKRNRTIHPTPSGGWSPRSKPTVYRASIPNLPTWLQRMSAFTSSAFVYLLPKLAIGDVAASVLIHLNYVGWVKWFWHAADITPVRFLITAAIVAVTAILPGSVVKVFSRLSGHFWRQLWLPSWVSWAFEVFITEFTGGPGYQYLQTLPGRGWIYQFYLWALALCAILPGLQLQFLVPWMFYNTAFPWVLPLIAIASLAENLSQWLGYLPVPNTFFSAQFGLYEWTKRFFLSGQTLGLTTAAWATYYSVTSRLRHPFLIVFNFLVWLSAYQPNTGNCNRVGTLPALPKSPPKTVRRLNVDIPLPPVTLLPASIPSGNTSSTLAVEPVGLSYHDWLDQLQIAYQANPNAYPALTPGQDCFWECCGRLGGTPHMWYSWFMAYTRRTPSPVDPVIGNVDMPLIQEFATASRLGVDLQGLIRQVIQTQGSDRPTLTLTVKRSLIGNAYHIEWTDPQPNTTPVANLARILATIRRDYAQWDVDIINRFNRTPVDWIHKPTPLLQGWAGDHDLPESHVDISDAIVASMTCAPLHPFPDDEGFPIRYDLGLTAPWPPLFQTFAAPDLIPIARTAPATMWQRFRKLGRTLTGPLRLRVVHPHPSGDPVPGMPPIKIGASRSQLVDNSSRNNLRPDPALWTVLRSELAQSLQKYQHLALPPVPLEAETITYVADLARASRLMADLKAHPSVLETRGNPSVLQSLDSVLDCCRLEGKTVSIPITCYLGVWGCGKTTATIAYLHTLTPEERTQVRIVSHTESLRAQARIKVDFPELRGFNFPTLASILSEPSTGPVIFDDAGKFWGGTLDLVILTNPLVSEIIVNGDPGQTSSKFPVPGTQSEFDLSPIAAVSKFTTKYATITHRGFRLLSDTMGVHTTNPNAGHITHTVSGKSGIPVCTASPRYVQVLSSYGRRAYTYSTVQGEDFKEDLEVDMTGLEGAILDSAAYTAITRSSTGVFLHMEAANPTSIIRKPPTGSDLMNAIVYAIRSSNTSGLTGPDWIVKAAFYRHLHTVMPMLPWFATIGSSVHPSMFQNVASPAVASSASDLAPCDTYPFDPPVPSSGPFDTHIQETHFVAKELRELPTQHGQTDQFKDIAFVNPHVHKRSDTATYFESVRSRLTPSTYEQNLRRMLHCDRSDMCLEYDRLVPNPPLWSATKHSFYVDSSIAEYCSKRTEHAVISKLNAHDPDRSGSDIKITLKNQVIKKAEKRHKLKAIPGQLIHEYDISQTLGDAPYALFLENEIIPAFPKNFLFYRRLSPEAFISEYKSRWRVGNGAYSSDVTRWDVGCDAGLLNFDVHVMHRSQFPKDYIQDYITRRLSSRSQHGVMATMQNSGDRYTWPLNTVRRAVVTSLVCAIQPQDTLAINGDDAAVDRFCQTTHFPDSPWEFKDDNGSTVEFSGFSLGDVEPTYSAEGILYRTFILMSRDPSAQDKWVNYLDLLQHADKDSPEAVEVARCAHQHMRPDLFSQYLPAHFRALFPSLVF